MFTGDGRVFDSVDKNEELVKSEINKTAILNRLFDTEKFKETGLEVDFIKSYSKNCFDFIEVGVDIDHFCENHSKVNNYSKSRYFNILNDLLRKESINIVRAKMVITDTKNYLILTNKHRGKEKYLLVIIDEDDVSISIGRNPNKYIHTAVQLVEEAIVRLERKSENKALAVFNSIGDDNNIKVRVVTYENVLIDDMMNQENRYIENRFDLDQNKNESVFINVFKNLEKYEVENITEDYIADILDSRYFSVSNVIQSSLISEKDNKYLSGDFGVLKIGNTDKAFELNDNISDYIKSFLNGVEVDRFYTKENIYIIVVKNK